MSSNYEFGNEPRPEMPHLNSANTRDLLTELGYIDQITTPATPEIHSDQLEQFLPRQQAAEIIKAAMSYATDDEGTLMAFGLSDEELVHTTGTGNVFGPNEKVSLYIRLIQERRIPISPANIDKVRALLPSMNQLENILSAHPDLHGALEKGRPSAYHISHESTADGSLADGETRIYIPGKLSAVEITRKMIEAGADFSYIKTWLPEINGEHLTILYRSDAPIFQAKNANQLWSIITTLRDLHKAGNIELDDEVVPPVGLLVPGLPGVFIGQNRVKKSFNSEMGSVFGGEGFLDKPAKDACNKTPIFPGEVVTDAWIDAAADKLQSLAQEATAAHGRNPRHHALLAEQDEKIILDAITLG